MFYGEEEQKVNGDSMSDINAELEHFNWGAFFLGWIWAIFNGAWRDIWPVFLIQVLFFIVGQFFLGFVFGILILLLEIYIGKKGNEWAYYGTKKWKNLEHFRKVQRNWVGASIAASIILNFSLTFIVMLFGMSLAANPAFKAHKKAQARQAKKLEKSSEYPTISVSKDINYSFSTIKPETLDYLKSRSEIKDYFDGKKLVIYFTGADCPYAQVFEKALEPIKNSSTMSSVFNFYAAEASGMKTFSSQEDAQADIDFNNSCHEFCVINTKNGQMFAIDGVGETEASTVGLILFQLANW